MRIYHDHVMAPLWPTIERVVAAELRSRAWQLATEGAEATLNLFIRGSVGVTACWKSTRPAMPTSILPDVGLC